VFSIIGRPSLTNARLAAALVAAGLPARVAGPEAVAAGPGDVVLGRLDVRRTLDGVEDGLWRLQAVARAGGRLLNRPGALLTAHDKLSTAVALGRAGLPHPRTAHVRDARLPLSFGPPYVVKPASGAGAGTLSSARRTPSSRPRCAPSPGGAGSGDRAPSSRSSCRRRGSTCASSSRAGSSSARSSGPPGPASGGPTSRSAPPGRPLAGACGLALRAVEAAGSTSQARLARAPDGGHVVSRSTGVDFTEYGLGGEIRSRGGAPRAVRRPCARAGDLSRALSCRPDKAVSRGRCVARGPLVVLFLSVAPLYCRSAVFLPLDPA
jgi:hypothetical protein